MTMQLTTSSIGGYVLEKELHSNNLGSFHLAREIDSDETNILIHIVQPIISNLKSFKTRFEMLKSILPTIQHPNLVSIQRLGHEGNNYYIARLLPSSNIEDIVTLEKYMLTNPTDHTLSQILKGIAEGLRALETVSNDYYKEGIVVETLNPRQIYLDLSSTNEPIPQIDGFVEPFLFFGDKPEAALHYHFQESVWHWNQQTQNHDPFAYQHLYPYHNRHGIMATKQHTVYSFGALTYYLLTGNTATAIFPKVSETNASIEPFWDDIVEKSLSPKEQGGFDNMHEIVLLLRKHINQQNKVTTKNAMENVIPPEGMALVYIPEKVILGANNGPKNEQPPFKARVKPFFIDIVPVTCQQFEQFLSSYERSTYSPNDDQPATLVTWYMAKAYCRWRSINEGLPEDTYRLPTEYEWEAAVRGSTGTQYPWTSDNIKNLIYCGQHANTGTLPVKQMTPGRFGLYDMLGNAWEWTESQYKGHPFSADRERTYSKDLRVVKGGCWLTPFEECRASLRSAFSPHERRGNVGFRCARNVALPESS